jgi:hypothetical protein
MFTPFVVSLPQNMFGSAVFLWLAVMDNDGSVMDGDGSFILDWFPPFLHLFPSW